QHACGGGNRSAGLGDIQELETIPGKRMRLRSGVPDARLGAEAELADAPTELFECLAGFENDENPFGARTQRDPHIDARRIHESAAVAGVVDQDADTVGATDDHL